MWDIIYIFWGLLPLGLLIVALITTLNNYSRKNTNEYTTDYLKQFAYAASIYAVFILIDKTVMPLISDLELLQSLEIDTVILRWLLYPALLVFFASIQQHFENQKTEEERQERRKRQMRYAAK